MAERRPILVRFEGEWLLAKVDAWRAERGLSRNAAILHLLTVQLGVEAPPEAAGSPGMASGPGGSLSSDGTSSPAEAGTSSSPGEGASKAEPLRTVPRRDPAGTEAPPSCTHGRAAGEFCYPCGGRV